MKQIVFVGLIFCILNSKAGHLKMKLQKALDLKLVKASVKSLGGYQGYCTVTEVKNLTKDSLTVLVEAGRRLNSLDDRQQDILVVKEELIVLKRDEKKSVKLKGYCCQSSKSAPQENARYDINQVADTNLVKVAGFLNRNSFDKSVEQQAIWAVSDNKPIAGIYDTSVVVNSLRQLVAGIKGEKLPWYSLVYCTRVFRSGAIVNHPLWLKGAMEFSSNESCYATLYVLDDKGQQVCLTESRWVNTGNKQSYEINLPVKDLEKGKYTIELRAQDKLLKTEEFSI